MVAAGWACGGSNANDDTGCTGLSACCATLSGEDAEQCKAAVDGAGATDAQCTQALNLWKSSGVCGGGGSDGTDGGGKGGDDHAVPSASGCAALSDCCPDLPVLQDPMACLTVAKEGTAKACEESLATYISAGYCAPDAGPPQVTVDASPGDEGVRCHELTGTGSSEVCAFVESSMTGFSCSALGMLESGSCPSNGLFGCCITVQTMGLLVTSAACYYSATTGGSAETQCTGSGKSWATTAP
jgi:hypothetical protein